MRILFESVDGPRTCAYLPKQQALIQYQSADGLRQEEYESLMLQNYRKFGQLLFRPICLACKACQPLRTVVKNFAPDRSMKRCILMNQDLKISIGPAVNSIERIELFNRYHDKHGSMRNWNPNSISKPGYNSHFLESEILIEEIAVYKVNQIVALMLFEELAQGISLIYYYYDPDLCKRSLGTFMILNAIALAKKRMKDFVYLGYYVSGSKSMEYKARFKPNQILVNGVWQE